MNKPITDWNKYRDQFVRETLRRASFRWPPRNAALKEARSHQEENTKTGRICWKYKCAGCLQTFLAKEVRIDHVQPVVPVNPYDNKLSAVREAVQPASSNTLDLGSFVLRMLCETNGFQILCNPCHDTKTARESKDRAEYRKARISNRGEGNFPQVGTSNSPKGRSKGRSGKAIMEPPSLEGSRGDGTGINLRSKEVQPQWVAKCSKCQRPVPSGPVASFICNECGGTFRP